MSVPGIGDLGVQPNPAGGAGAPVRPNNPFAKTADELAALESFTTDGWPAELADKQGHLMKQFTQTQQALQEKIRQFDAGFANIEALQRKAQERDWMAAQPAVVDAAYRVAKGLPDPTPGQGAAQPGQPAGPGAAAGAPGTVQDVLNQAQELDPSMMDAASFRQVLQNVASAAETAAAATATAEAQKIVAQSNDQYTPLMEQLVTREGQRTQAEMNNQFAQMQQYYPDFPQVQGDVQARMQQYPGMSVTDAYKLVGNGVTAAEAAANGLTPNGASVPGLEDVSKAGTFKETRAILQKNAQAMATMGQPAPGMQPYGAPPGMRVPG